MWVADQLVKNRRDTAELMRQMERDGDLCESGSGFYATTPDQEAQAA